MNANPGRAVEGCTGATPGAPSTGLSASAVADELAGTGGDVSGKVPATLRPGLGPWLTDPALRSQWDVLVAAKVEFDDAIGVAALAASIDATEAEIREALPAARLIFIEPDVYRVQADAD